MCEPGAPRRDVFHDQLWQIVAHPPTRLEHAIPGGACGVCDNGDTVDRMHARRLISSFAATLVSCWLGLIVVGAAAAVPKPAPRFWSVARCERVLPDEHPAIRQVICVGSGGPSSCRWTSGHRVRLFSQLRVFAWYRHANFSTLGMTGVEPGVVRSFTLATRARPGFARIVHRYGDAWEGWPPDFYMAHVRLLGTHVNRHAFGAFVATRVAELADHERTVDCTAA